MKNSARVTYNKIVNVAEDGEISVLSDVFMYKDGFKGATGNCFYPVSKKYYKEMTTLSAIKEYGEEEQFMFDTSDSELWDILRDELGLSENEAYIFECVGGGRMFDKNFQGNYNPRLSDIIRKYEN